MEAAMVGIGGANNGTVVVIAEGERVGHGVVVGQVGAGVVAHGENGVVCVYGNVRGDEAIVGAVIPALVLCDPAESGEDDRLHQRQGKH